VEEVEDSYEAAEDVAQEAAEAEQAEEEGGEMEGEQDEDDDEDDGAEEDDDEQWEEEEDEEEEEEWEEEEEEDDAEDEDEFDIEDEDANEDMDDRRSPPVAGVSWDGKHVHIGHHATKKAAPRAIDNYVKDGGDVPVKRGYSSRFKGVCWYKSSGQWLAQCNGKHLGYHATEEAAARAYSKYITDGVDPVQRRDGTSQFSSQFKGVRWQKSTKKWVAVCKSKYLGSHATEEAAARAYNIEAERIGRVDLTVIPPASDADGRGSHSFPFQLNLSSSVNRMTQPNFECVLELLKLSFNVNETKPLADGGGKHGDTDVTAPRGEGGTTAAGDGRHGGDVDAHFVSARAAVGPGEKNA